MTLIYLHCGLAVARRVCLPSLLLLMAASSSRQAPAGRQVLAKKPGPHVRVVVVRSPVEWRQSEKHPWKTLGGGDHSLPGGSWIRCGKGGQAQIWMLPDRQDLSPNTVRRLSAPPPGERDRIQTALDELERIPGRLKAPLTVLWPQEGRPVWPETFVFRWQPVTGKVTLQLRDVAAEESFWERSGLEGMAGQFDSSDARAKLRVWRRRNPHVAGGQGILMILRPEQAASMTSQLEFGVLSAGEEKALRAELTFWNTQTRGLLQHLGQAELFWRYDLLPESAVAYEQALQFAPDDTVVRRRAVAGYEAMGDWERARQLQPPGRLVVPTAHPSP